MCGASGWRWLEPRAVIPRLACTVSCPARAPCRAVLLPQVSGFGSVVRRVAPLGSAPSWVPRIVSAPDLCSSVLHCKMLAHTCSPCYSPRIPSQTAVAYGTPQLSIGHKGFVCCSFASAITDDSRGAWPGCTSHVPRRKTHAPFSNDQPTIDPDSCQTESECKTR